MLCAICLENIEDNNNCKTECGHTFHTSCMLKLVTNKTNPSNNCPMCRKQLLSPPSAPIATIYPEDSDDEVPSLIDNSDNEESTPLNNTNPDNWLHPNRLQYRRHEQYPTPSYVRSLENVELDNIHNNIDYENLINTIMDAMVTDRNNPNNTTMYNTLKNTVETLTRIIQNTSNTPNTHYNENSVQRNLLPVFNYTVEYVEPTNNPNTWITNSTSSPTAYPSTSEQLLLERLDNMLTGSELDLIEIDSS